MEGVPTRRRGPNPANDIKTPMSEAGFSKGSKRRVIFDGRIVPPIRKLGYF